MAKTADGANPARQGALCAKLQAQCAETRYLVPFGLQLAPSIGPRDDHWVAVIALFTELTEILSYTSADQDFDLDVVARRSRRICALAVYLEMQAVESGKAPAWRTKPKLFPIYVRIRCCPTWLPETLLDLCKRKLVRSLG